MAKAKRKTIPPIPLPPQAATHVDFWWKDITREGAKRAEADYREQALSLQRALAAERPLAKPLQRPSNSRCSPKAMVAERVLDKLIDDGLVLSEHTRPELRRKIWSKIAEEGKRSGAKVVVSRQVLDNVLKGHGVK